MAVSKAVLEMEADGTFIVRAIPYCWPAMRSNRLGQLEKCASRHPFGSWIDDATVGHSCRFQYFPQSTATVLLYNQLVRFQCDSSSRRRNPYQHYTAVKCYLHIR